MHSFRFARTWWLIAVLAAGLLVAATPTAGRIFEPATHTWSVAQTPNPGYYGNIVHSISARTTSDAWAVGVQATETSNDTLALHWNGRSWASVPTPNLWPDCQDGDILWTGNSLNAVDAVSANDAWAVGTSCYSLEAVIEHWNGSAWSLVPIPNRKHGFDSTAELAGVDAVSASNIWAVGYADDGSLRALIEHYNGTTWSEVPSGTAGYLNALSASGASDVWAVGSADYGNHYGSLIEHFNGTTWSVVSSPQPAGGSSLDSVVALSPTNAWAVGTKIGLAPHAGTFVLHWDGSTWSEVPSPNPSYSSSAENELRSIAVVSKNDIWAVGTYENEQTHFHQDRTLTLHWDGSSWEIADSPTPGLTGQLTAIDAAPPTSARSSTAGRGRLFAAGFYSLYEKNIYDGHYTLPQTLVLR
jgi:hypothetical protein